jgi:hypothetical protein
VDKTLMGCCGDSISTDDLHRNPIHHNGGCITSCIAREVIVDRKAGGLTWTNQIYNPQGFVVSGDDPGNELKLLEWTIVVPCEEF